MFVYVCVCVCVCGCVRRAHGGTLHAHAHAHAHACLQQAHGGGTAARARAACWVDEHGARARWVEVVERRQVVGRQAAARRRLVSIGKEELAHDALLGIGRSAQHDAPLGVKAVERGGLVRRVGRGVGGVREGDILRVDVAVVEREQVAHLVGVRVEVRVRERVRVRVRVRARARVRVGVRSKWRTSCTRAARKSPQLQQVDIWIGLGLWS